MSSYDQQFRARNEYPPQQYGGPNDGAFNPYDQPGFGGQYTDAAAPVPQSKEKESTAYMASRAATPKSPRSVRRWRYEHQGNLWRGGSGIRCCGRFFCCSLLLFLFFLISIVLSLLLWVKPPNVEVGSVAPVSDGSAFQVQNDGITINLAVPISVDNPNYFSVKFDSIDADIFYPLNNTHIGGGSLKGLNLGSNAQTNFTLPFALNYTTDIDPNSKILLDIANHCGFTGNAATPIKVDYEIHLDFKILFIPIKPTIKNSASFKCPITEADVADLLKGAGINIPNLAGLFKMLFD